MTSVLHLGIQMGFPKLEEPYYKGFLLFGGPFGPAYFRHTPPILKSSMPGISGGKGGSSTAPEGFMVLEVGGRTGDFRNLGHLVGTLFIIRGPTIWGSILGSAMFVNAHMGRIGLKRLIGFLGLLGVLGLPGLFGLAEVSYGF